MNRNTKTNDHRYPPAGTALVILPAILLGVLAMNAADMPPSRWGQQLGAWFVFALAAWALRHVAGRVPDLIWGILFLVLPAVTLFGQGADGVRRWLALGPVQINAGMLVLPALLVVLCRVKNPEPFMIGAAVITCFQPDLSQLAAFCAAALPIVWLRRKNPVWRAGMIILFCLLAYRCFRIPADIPPAEFSEGILTVLGNGSAVRTAAGWISLIIIPVFWIYGYYKYRKLPMLCMAVYYTAVILFVLSGEYPVPFMGFGLSPIAGYWLAYAMTGKEDPSDGLKNAGYGPL